MTCPIFSASSNTALTCCSLGVLSLFRLNNPDLCSSFLNSCKLTFFPKRSAKMIEGLEKSQNLPNSRDTTNFAIISVLGS